MHILFAGGGTAGHINPALAIAGYFLEKEPDTKISYIGTARNLEARLVTAAGYDFYTIDVVGFKRKITPKNILLNISAVGKAVGASLKVRKILKNLKPDIVIGTGGYVSGPVLREAAKLGIKTAIHEQNAYPGITTKALSSLVDRVMLAMPDAEKYLKPKNKPITVGNPVRSELTAITYEQARKILKLNGRPLILSFGGSLGARPINEAVSGLINHHNNSHKYYHIHATGKLGFQSTLENIKNRCNKISDEITIREYIDDMNVCMAAADLLICRAGAITLSELCRLSKPSILIPSPYVAENHQFHNAMTLGNKGAAKIIEEKDLTEESLIKVVEELLSDRVKLSKMAENAGKCGIANSEERIYKVIKELYSQK